MVTQEDIISAAKKVIDPDIWIDIYTLGLIYEIQIEEAVVNIIMTFTTPACPSGPQLIGELKEKILELEGVEEVNVTVTFEPAWQPSDDLKMMMGLY